MLSWKAILAFGGMVVCVFVLVYGLPLLSSQNIREYYDEAFLIDDDVVLGRPDAPVLLVEFGDYACVHCGELAQDVFPRLKREFVEKGKVRMVFRDFVNPENKLAGPAAVAAWCAREEYWKLYEQLYANAYVGDAWAILTPRGAGEIFSKYATERGLNTSSCLIDPTSLDEVQKDMESAINLGIAGTPTIFIGNEELGFVRVVGVGEYEAYEEIINDLLR